MNARELRQQSIEALKEQREELRRVRFDLRMKKAAGELSETHLVRRNRKDLGRLEAIISEKQSRGSLQ